MLVQDTVCTVEELWQDYSRSRDIDTRNELIMRYLFIPKRVVGRMISSVGSYLSADDLMSCGILGLIDAVEKFEVSKETKFEAYAYMRVKGEVIDHLRSLDWAPISLRHKIKKVESAFEEAEREGSGNVTEQAIAEKLNMNVGEVQKILENSFVFNLIYMEDALKFNSVVSHYGYPEDVCEGKERRHLLTQYISILTDKEKTVLNLYYVEDMTLKEIGMVLGLTESRVCQINSKILMKLRNKFKNSGY